MGLYTLDLVSIRLVRRKAPQTEYYSPLENTSPDLHTDGPRALRATPSATSESRFRFIVLSPYYLNTSLNLGLYAERLVEGIAKTYGAPLMTRVLAVKIL